MSAPRKLGVLVAIPIKGRRLLNRSGGKQSPYVQLKLGDQKKRTKASLIAAAEPEWDQEIRLDVYQGNLDMLVTVYDEGKRNELIGEGILRLHQVIDKGELDVWFLIKNNGVLAGDIYFELTFYAVAPPPVVGAPMPHTQAQHPAIRYAQPGHMPAGRPPPPHASHVTAYGNMPRPGPFPGNIYQHPTGIQGAYLQPPPITIIVSSPGSFGVPSRDPALNNSFGPGGPPPPPPQPFQPKVQYNPNPNNNMPHIPQSNFAPQGNSPGRYPMPQPQPQPGMHNPAMRMPVPHPTGGQNIGCGPNLNGKPNQFPNDRRSPCPQTPTPPVRYK